MSVDYDEKVLVSFADRLYRRASSVVALYAVLGGVFGAAMVSVGGVLASRSHEWAVPNVLTLIVAAISAYLGARAGSDRAFALRLMAQTALCQVQIERNTRAAADVHRPANDARSSSLALPPPSVDTRSGLALPPSSPEVR